MTRDANKNQMRSCEAFANDSPIAVGVRTVHRYCGAHDCRLSYDSRGAKIKCAKEPQEWRDIWQCYAMSPIDLFDWLLFLFSCFAQSEKPHLFSSFSCVHKLSMKMIVASKVKSCQSILNQVAYPTASCACCSLPDDQDKTTADFFH